MPAARAKDDFKYYMHDGPTAYSFEIAGRISDNAARELAQVWKTPSSTADGLALIVDLSYVTQVDEAGRQLLRDWYDSGAQLVAKRPHSRTLVTSITGQAFDPLDEPAQHHTWRPLNAFLAVMVAMLLCPDTVFAAQLLN